MGIATYYRGRISYNEVLELEMKHFQALRHEMYLESLKEGNSESKAAEMLEDELLESGVT